MRKITGYKNVTLLVSILLVLAMAAGLAACAPAQPVPPSTSPAAPTVTQPQDYPAATPKVRFKIATTTSLYDTGLWYYLEPMFEQKANVEMDIIYAGTGIALEYGRRGDVDAVIVHDPAAEDKFINEGFGMNRRYFAYNYFLIAGPADDPAGIKDMLPADAFKKLYESGKQNPDKVKFVSRGDDSGTHAKEKLIWKAAGLNYDDVLKSSEWYIEAGKGMGPCLLMANEMQAYLLADISTYLSYKGKVSLVSLVEKGDIFLNNYAAMAVNPEKIKTAKIDIANKFINWLISSEIQGVIGTYGVKEYGRSLFFPLSAGGCKDAGCPDVAKNMQPVPEK